MKTLEIVSVYTREESLKGTMDELLSMKKGFDALVINDGPKDHTSRICLEKGYSLLDLSVSASLTNGFQTGVKYAQREGYDAVLQFDVNGQRMLGHISRMIRCLEETQIDIVNSSRFVDPKKPFSSRMAASMVHFFVIRKVRKSRFETVGAFFWLTLIAMMLGFTVFPGLVHVPSGLFEFTFPSILVFLCFIAALLMYAFSLNAKIAYRRGQASWSIREIVLREKSEGGK